MPGAVPRAVGVAMAQEGMPVRERPIRFSGEMVRAILAGRKSMTRRVVTLRRGFGKCCADCPGPILARAWADPGTLATGGYLHVPCGCGAAQRLYAPWAPGDRLWVRETWANVPLREDDGGQGDRTGCIYRADGDDAFDALPDEWQFTGRWRPSIFMPRGASRLTLDVLAVRAERLQDITISEAIAEGVPWTAQDDLDLDTGQGCSDDTPVTRFAALWDRHNAPRWHPWEANEWVWATTFRRIEP